MQAFANLDLLSVGIMVITTCVLGFAVYFNNRQSLTHKIFLLLTLDFAIWGILNYFAYQFSDPNIGLWFIRGVLFFATFQALLIYELFRIFPNPNYNFSKTHNRILIPIVIVVACLTLTPFVFSGFSNTIIIGKVTGVIKGPAWPLFALTAVVLVLGAFLHLIKKLFYSHKSDRTPLLIILIGFIITFSLIITLNLFLPILFNNTLYIPLSSLFLFPFIACTSYAILRHGLFKLKVTETMSLIIILLIITFVQVVFSKSTIEVIFRSSVFFIVLFLSILLLKIVIREIQQRKEIQDLAIKLEDSNQKLIELDALKTEFVSLATHHISTPLTAIHGYISLLKEGDFEKNSKEEKDVFVTLLRLTDSMSALTKDFIETSHLDKDNSDYIFSNLNPKDLLQEIVDEFSPRMEKKGLHLVFSLNDSSDTFIKGDWEKLKKAISNILNNSLKYTTDGTIEITLTTLDKKYLITISDTGKRNLPTISPRLVEKFSTRSDQSEANIIGNNLSIYVAKQVIEAHKGRFWIETKEKSEKTAFIVEFVIDDNL